jgi:hypothetical protein
MGRSSIGTTSPVSLVLLTLAVAGISMLPMTANASSRQGQAKSGAKTPGAKKPGAKRGEHRGKHGRRHRAHKHSASAQTTPVGAVGQIASGPSERRPDRPSSRDAAPPPTSTSSSPVTQQSTRTTRTHSGGGSNPGNASLATFCSFYGTHSLFVSTHIWFNLSRFPNGGYTSLRYAYARVNSAGYLISDYSITNFTSPTFIRPNIQNFNLAPGFGQSYVVDWSPLDGRYLNANYGYAGGTYYVALVQVAVYNGQAYEYVPWTWSRSYSNGPSSIGLTDEGNFCLLSF